MAACRCCGACRCASPTAASPASSAPTARARRRCCAPCPACCEPAPAASLRRRAIDGLRPDADPGARHRPRARGAPVVRQHVGGGQFADGRLWPRALARPGLERAYALFPRLKERRRQDAATLSGGEQQMCAIARGLMSRAAAAADRRTVPGPGAEARGRVGSLARGSPGERHVGAARGTGCGDGARSRRRRVRAGWRTCNPRRSVRTTRRRPKGQGSLPGVLKIPTQATRHQTGSTRSVNTARQSISYSNPITGGRQKCQSMPWRVAPLATMSAAK